MVTVYMIIGIVIAAVFAAFALSRAYSNHREAAISGLEVATPSPGPNSAPKAIDLSKVDKDTIVGTKFFQRLNSPGGGQGQTVDGIPCESSEAAVLHIHVHLSIFNRGKQIAIPQYAGMAATTPTSVCLYWLHTHDASGIIHLEASQVEAPQGGLYTLGNFFDIWGYTLGPEQIASFKGPVTTYVNGQIYTGDLKAIELTSHKQIVLEVGTPLVPPPTYTFPLGY
ncbi:MAG TPA: hypothetical protein VMS32_09740 [Verrucomicrobiae bacterium]|jgi:hypothetical protein|nr:hypothetical protein [Verrucomicrobiae bacterium]